MLCLASEVKGQAFLRQCHRDGWRTILITRESLADGDWPREAISEVFYLPSLLARDQLLAGVSYLARTRDLDHIVALDDFDVEGAAALREHLRIPGFGVSRAHYFRDKLAMRVAARDAGIRVPRFVHILNHERIRRFMEDVPAPWFLKPRSEGSAAGIKRITQPDDLWQRLDSLGDRQSSYLLEQYIGGDVYHVDAIVSEREVVFAVVSRYGQPPFDVMHGGGLFTTRTLPDDHPDARRLLEMNRAVLAALGFVRGVAHTEFIRGRDDGDDYFLETAARVGGAHIVELVEAASGVNLWEEWAKLEMRAGRAAYVAPEKQARHAGLIVSLARQEWPDTSSFADPEIVWRLNRKAHVGLIVASEDSNRVGELLAGYSRRIRDDFFAAQPGLERLNR